MSNPRAKFPKSSRLLAANDFKRVFQRPRRSSSQSFTVLAVTNQQRKPRLGLAVAKKHLRSAVSRNRVKRVVRESFRLWQTKLANYDLVVLSRSGVVGKTKAELQKEIEKHWTKLVN